MAHIILVTGGSRSGKSAYAQRLAESLPGPRLYLATCPVSDEEMRQRIGRGHVGRNGRKRTGIIYIPSYGNAAQRVVPDVSLIVGVDQVLRGTAPIGEGSQHTAPVAG